MSDGSEGTKPPSSRLSVELRFSPDARCAFCHDTLDDQSAVCPGCKTVLHRDCREQLPECPTMGCKFSVFTCVPDAPRTRPIVTRPAFRAALSRMQQWPEKSASRARDPRHAEWEAPTLWEQVGDTAQSARQLAKHLALVFVVLACMAGAGISIVVSARSEHPGVAVLLALAFISVGAIFAVVTRMAR